MVNFQIELAGFVIDINVNFERTKNDYTAYIVEKTPDLSLTITQEDLLFEKAKCIREDAVEGRPPRKTYGYIVESTAVQRKLAEFLFDHNTIVFHGSVVAVDGQGYLFTAKSGTGKSTHTGFWRQIFGDRAVMVNDDKPFLRITDSGVLVCGSPWNGKHGLGNNICVPLKAICVLERGEENEVMPVDGKELLYFLLQQSNRPLNPQKMPKYMDLISELSGKTSFYRMKCNLDPDAARVAFEAMSK
ncbi:MAG: hypothetical protein E7439_06350 [Ruminococcaceae bacterium]|nr:hypothetical protein [Oscillospiraceae bacterium]